MCLVEKFTDIYPDETRIKKITHRCLFSPRRGTCSRIRVYDHGEAYHTRRAQLESPRTMAPSRARYQIIQHAEPSRSRECSRPPTERRPSPKRQSRPFRLYFPFFRRGYEFEVNRNTLRRREGERAARPFVVDSPETSRHNRQSTQPLVHTASPRRGRSPVSERRTQEYPADFTSTRDQQPYCEPRRPRERSPVAERVPLGRRQSSLPHRIVEIHNHRPERNGPPRAASRERYEERSPQPRRVRFSSNVEYATITDDRNDNRGQSGGSEQINFPQDNIDRRYYEAVEERPSRRQEERQRRRPSPWPGMQRSRTSPNIAHIRPRIIQDGYRQISRVGERLCTEGRIRPNHETTPRDLESQSTERPRTVDSTVFDYRTLGTREH